MSVWVVQCQVEHITNGWAGSVQVPTFNLDPRYVGYEDNENLRAIVCDIVDPLRKASHVHISADLL